MEFLGCIIASWGGKKYDIVRNFYFWDFTLPMDLFLPKTYFFPLQLTKGVDHLAWPLW